MDDDGFHAGREWLMTDLILDEDIRGARPLRLLAIDPNNGDRWTFAVLTFFLNEQTHL
jgi:hypothetical protein